ncbi:hypothetical protein BO94DRAFT_538544 [Aspergillus sclerotioniger CBS 115572]|uniref:Uncharacterized protein n=1 Tax=Aspergillus sclerotioniger CBS 115572 TaxID=1450535 RepID=A0A317VQ92_9EURO|nr:hypothetical protein BO94DRAFT_538544 [Aspergillus sclerotioniger CBS 115572]PWY75217.1 hypothetical protein BO94DRAFT_538544 [Aspergillus sclerotioniger CBS 115572]
MAVHWIWHAFPAMILLVVALLPCLPLRQNLKLPVGDLGAWDLLHGTDPADPASIA